MKFFITLLLSITSCYGALSVPFTVKETAGVGSDGYPVTAIIPLNKGTYDSVDTFRVVDENNNTVPAQFHALNRWWSSDNSIRHVKVYFQPEVAPYTGPDTGITQYYLQDDGTGNNYSSNLTVAETSSDITVTTGPLRFTVPKQNFNLINEAYFDTNSDGTFNDNERVINASLNNGGVFVGRLAGDIQRDSSFTNTVVEIEEVGPMQVVIKASSPTIFNSTDDHKHGFAVRIYAYANKPYVKIDYQLQNSAKNVVYSWPLYFEKMGLEFDLNLGSNPTIRYGLGADGINEGAGSGFHLVQTDDRDYKLYASEDPAGTIIQTGEEPDGYMDFSSGSLGLTAITRYFWEQYPNALTARANGDLAIDLFPEGEARWYVSGSGSEERLQESSSGLYWLDDMQHIVKEVMLYFHDGGATNTELSQLATTVDYHPVPVVPLSWYQETKATVPGFGGEVPTTVNSGNETGRTNQWAANNFVKEANGRFNYQYKFGSSTFGAEELSRRKKSCGTGGYPSSGISFITSGNAETYFRQTQWQLSELNHRPQWMADYTYAEDYATLNLEGTPYCGPSWRDFQGNGTSTLAANYLPETTRDWTPRDDPHGWYQHIEESYYTNGDLWTKDWYAFITEYRKPYVLGNVPYGYGQQRGSAHILMNAMQAYRINGDLDLLDKTQALVQFLWDEHGDDQTMLNEAGSFQTGFLLRGLIEYIEEVEDYNPQAWAEAFRTISAWIEWNEVYGNFGYYVDPGTVGSSGGAQLTLVDPQAWYYWHTGKQRFKTHLDQYVNSGINGNTPYGDFSQWSGQYQNRFRQYVEDNLPLRQQDMNPPDAVSDLIATRVGADIRLEWTTPATAKKFFIVWDTKPISESYTNDASTSNWWAANPLGTALVPVPGATQSLTFDPNESETIYVALFTFDDIFDAMPNMSAMSNVAIEDVSIDDTPPSAPINPQAQALSENSIQLTWTAAIDNESGIQEYIIKRDGNAIATVDVLTWTDTELNEATQYDYTIEAVNWTGLLSSPASVSALTLADTTAPTIESVMVNNATEISIVFSETVASEPAQDAASYAISGITILNASLSADLQTVTLTTSQLQDEIDYTLTVSNVRDRATTPNIMAPVNITITKPSLPSNGLIHAWLFEEVSGDTVINSVDSTFNGTFANGSATPSRTAGVIGNALSFDGNDRVQIPDTFNLQGDAFTLSLWMNLASSQAHSDARLFSKATGTATNAHIFMLSLYNNTSLRCRLKTTASSNTTTLIGDANVFQSDTWHHVTVAYDGSSLRMLIDGNEVGSTNITGDIAQSNAGVALGNQPDGAGDKSINGMLDQVRIYNRALTADEIEQLRNEMPPAPPYVQYYSDFIAQYFEPAELLDDTIVGELMDPDHDGLANLIEYFMATHPKLSEQAYMKSELKSGQLVFTYQRLANPQGVDWQWETSIDLIDWQPVISDSEQILEDMGNVQLIESRFDSSSDTKVFYRLKLNKN